MVVVLGAAIATSLLPADGQAIVFRTPLLIVVLLIGTAAALWGSPDRDGRGLIAASILPIVRTHSAGGGARSIFPLYKTVQDG